MIYTITFNPALDYISQVENFEIGKINRTQSEKILPGGKGLNVSIVLKNLGIENTAIGFIAGFTGKELRRAIEEYGIKTDFIEVKNGITRINVKITSKEQAKKIDDEIKQEETALNGIGPEITEENINQLLEKIQNMKKEDIVVLSGNVPKGVQNDIYEKICKILSQKNITFIVDSTRELLINVLKYKPFLIKPNKEELEETFKIKINTKEEIIKNAQKLQSMGAENVLISLGGDGAILVTKENKEYYSKAPKGKVLNTVGAGDSMVAGFLAGYIENREYEKAFKIGIATGSASAFSMDLATRAQVEMLLKEI